MNYDTEVGRSKLIEELKSYWINNGWKLQTLTKKTSRELLGIRATMLRNKSQNKQSKIQNKQIKYNQLNLFGG